MTFTIDPSGGGITPGFGPGFGGGGGGFGGGFGAPAPAPIPRQLIDAIEGLGAAMRDQAKVLLRTRQRLYALEAESLLRTKGRTPVYPVEFRSQYGEDLHLWDILGGQETGFFIEVGAFDGYSFSVTYALEAIGWKGLLIEAIPARYEACAKRRTGSRVVHGALSKRGSSGTAEFKVVDDQFGGMLSYLNASQQHLSDLAQSKVAQRSVSVPLTTMNDLLKDHTGEIDVAVIDVEGGEIDLLDGFDLRHYRPRVLMLEDNTLGQDPRLAQYMSAFPYVQTGWLAVNRVYVRSDLSEIIERAKTAIT